MKKLFVTARLLSSAVALLFGGLAVTGSCVAATVPLALQHSSSIAPAGVRARLVYVANYLANSVTAYPAGASGNVRPVITLAGPHTRLSSPYGLAHDPQGRLFVLSFDASLGVDEVLVFARGANGDAAPVRSLQVLSYPSVGGDVLVQAISLAVDWSGYTYVGVIPWIFGYSSAVAVYGPAAHGTDVPLRTFSTGSSFSDPFVAVNGAGQVYVVHTVDRDTPGGFQKYSAFGDGNAFLDGLDFSNLNDFSGGELSVAPRSGNVYAVTNAHITILNATFTKVIGFIAGSGLKCCKYGGIAVDGTGQVYVGASERDRVEIFADGAHGYVAPSRTITGPNTGLNGPFAITLTDSLL